LKHVLFVPPLQYNIYKGQELVFDLAEQIALRCADGQKLPDISLRD
jgi:hypothetical protein